LFFLIRLDDTAHRVIYAAFIQIFVGLDLTAILVSDPHQKKPSLPAIDGNLADNLVKALIKKLLPGRTEAYFPGLPVDKSFVELLTELNDLDFSGRSGKDRLDPELTVVSPVLFGREDLA
jgi:hypothetical protein